MSEATNFISDKRRQPQMHKISSGQGGWGYMHDNLIKQKETFTATVDTRGEIIRL